jgi:7-cyano-7-deazaguanine synthase
VGGDDVRGIIQYKARFRLCTDAGFFVFQNLILIKGEVMTEFKKPSDFFVEEDKKKAVVLMSGGLDSSVMAAYLLEKNWSIFPITFDYGSKHNEAEFDAVLKVCKKLNVLNPKLIKLDFVNELFVSDLLKSGGDIPDGHYAEESMKLTVVPGRNSIMLSIAAGLAESINYNYVCYANHTGDHFIYPDCRTEFVKAMNEMVQISSDNKVNLYAPFDGIMKWDIARIGAKHNVPLELTWSCYNGNPPIHCGTCGTCVERYEAFKVGEISDPTQYEDNPEKYLNR